MSYIYIGVVYEIPSANQNIPLNSYPVCKYYEGPIGNGATETLTCDQLISGQYLIIQLNTATLVPLTLCEVQVFGGKVLTNFNQIYF